MPQAQAVAVPQRFPLVIEAGNRDTTTDTDAKLVNCYMETHASGESQEHWIYKRPGLFIAGQFGGNGYGCYQWRGSIYSIFGSTVYKDAVSLGTVDATGGVYAFNSTLGGTPYLVFGNGVAAYYTDGTTLTQMGNYAPIGANYIRVGSKYTIVSVGTTDFTLIGASANTIGTVFTATNIGMGTGTAALTATSFVAGAQYQILTVGTTNFTLIGAASNTVGLAFTASGAGTGTGTVSSINFLTPFCKGWAYLDGRLYILLPDAFIQGSGVNDPANWDAANSVLAQIEPDRGVALSKQLVYVIAFKEWTTEVFYDAGNAAGSPLASVQGAKVAFGCASSDSVHSIDDVLFWLSLTRSSALQVIMMEGLKVSIISTKPVERLLAGADFSVVYSWSLKNEGHVFYGLTLKNSNLTIVYDLREKKWAQWTDMDGNYFPFVSSTYSFTTQHIFQHESNGNLYAVSRDYTDDHSEPIPVDIVTPNFDAGTRRRKTLNMLLFCGDTDGDITVRYNDYDYSSTAWSAYRTVNMDNVKPMLVNNGTFYRRAYQIHHEAPVKFRIQSIDMQLDLGTL